MKALLLEIQITVHLIHKIILSFQFSPSGLDARQSYQTPIMHKMTSHAASLLLCWSGPAAIYSTNQLIVRCQATVNVWS